MRPIELSKNPIDEPVGVEDHICISFLSFTNSFRSSAKAQMLAMEVVLLNEPLPET